MILHGVARIQRPRGRQSAFTLAELTVVVLTLTMLVTLMLPAVAISDDQGKRTVCFNNLRRLSMATSVYASDNLDFLAPPNWDGGDSGSGPGWHYTVTNGTIPDPGPSGAYSNNPTAAYGTGLWFQYVRDPKSYLCPVTARAVLSQCATISCAAT